MTLLNFAEIFADPTHDQHAGQIGQHTGHAHVACALADSSDFGLLGENVLQNVRFPAQDADESSAKFDAASFILGEKILNRINTHKITKKQTVTDISTPCLSARVDNQHNQCYIRQKSHVYFASSGVAISMSTSYLWPIHYMLPFCGWKSDDFRFSCNGANGPESTSAHV